MIDRIDRKDMKCKWLHCAYGMGLAGTGCCVVKNGDPKNPNCPEFRTEEQMLKEQRESMKRKS